ncbi:DNA-binding response regulator [Amycolatopsis sp. NBRC 101858]|uniref:response regulator transcription factor n=1 Tax=Amycolatopsis sp. NBRC 101858 TaxID=3032200 RepID=UPI0024A08AB1|nr:response regulator transcription factor [Amycolatopsis sp. NBRC 101858]GLY43439.1 DNA-binding response regulator [Amycolatopsis sp. NBRC 101858]
MDDRATLPGRRGATGRLVLVVDDDPRVRTVVTWQLEAEGFRVTEAPDGRRALETIERERLDLVILDLALPGVGGLDVLRRLRDGERAAGGTALPVIVLSGRSGETDRIVGLDLGADDYLVKPFSPGELAARVRSVLRRAAPAPPVTAAGLRIDHAAREVFFDGREITMTAKEFDLLAFLAAHPRQVFTRAQLLERVWASAAEWQSEATVTEHVHRLRQKLGPRLVRTVRGVGYRLEP